MVVAVLGSIRLFWYKTSNGLASSLFDHGQGRLSAFASYAGDQRWVLLPFIAEEDFEGSVVVH